MTGRVKAVPAAPNREAWLAAAVDHLRPLFGQLAGVDLPAELHVSVGFPKGNVRKVIGQCWPTTAADGVAQLFVSPTLVDPVQVLAVLAHELIHAWNDCKDGHKAPFGRVARAIGLEGKLTATHAGDELAETLKGIAADLGAYPHKAITLGGPGVGKTQTTRMIKVVCEADGYTLRTTRSWLDVGVPSCPCGATMAEAS